MGTSVRARGPGRPPAREIPWRDIRRAWDAGETPRELATRFGITRNYLYVHAHAHNWPPRLRRRKERTVDAPTRWRCLDCQQVTTAGPVCARCKNEEAA